MSKQIQSHIMQLYEVKKLLGSGAYGHVWKVVDKHNKKQCALKKIFDAFHNDVDAQRTYREITVLHQLEHHNIIKLHRVIKSKNNKDLYLVFEYMEADLHSLVGENVLQEVHLRFVIFQILKALKYLHSAQLIHRDLKPSNILINSQCEIKICDFGLVRSLTHQEDQEIILSQEVATRWYRSPEMLLGSKNYTKQTDVWSVGCIIAQLLIGNPIFPGQSTLNQLQLILQFTGIPSKQSIDSLESDNAQSLINQLTKIHRRSLQNYFKNSQKIMIDLVVRMLQFNPNKRITIDDAMNLDIFDQFRSLKNGDDLCTKFIVPQLDDNYRLNVSKYRQIIYRDIERRYPKLPYEMLNASSNFYDRPVSLQRKKFTRSHHSFKKNREICNQNESLPFTKESVHSASKQTGKNNKKDHSVSFTNINNNHTSSYYSNKVSPNNSNSQQHQNKNGGIIYNNCQQNLHNKLKKFQKHGKSSNKLNASKKSIIDKQNWKNESIEVDRGISQSKKNVGNSHIQHHSSHIQNSQLIKVRSRKILVKNRDNRKNEAFQGSHIRK